MAKNLKEYVVNDIVEYIGNDRKDDIEKLFKIICFTTQLQLYNCIFEGCKRQKLAKGALMTYLGLKTDDHACIFHRVSLKSMDQINEF